MRKLSRLRIVAALMLAAAAVPAVMAQQADSQNDGRYMVKFHDFQGAANAVAAAGGRVALELAPQKVIAAYLPEQALRGLQHNPNVEYVEVDPRRYPMAQTTPYGITMVQADDPSFARSDASVGSTVCVIDSGYYRNHEDLQANSYVTGDNNAGTGNWYEDSCGHGTHVAGTIAALNNSVGVIGVNSNGLIRLHIEKVFDGSSCGWAYTSSLIAALGNCQNAVANTNQKLVVSMSLGGSTSSRTENTAFQNAYNAGVLPVAAAGNAGTTATSYPAGYASVISVAAVDSTGTVASFSQQNADVELAAPGVAVVSTTPFKPSSLSAGGNIWLGANIDGSARSLVSGELVDGGLCDSMGAWSGKVVLCLRGGNTFAEKVANVLSGGGTGAAIYNNIAGGFAGTLNGTSAIPAISLSQSDGQAALAYTGQASTLDNLGGIGNGYEAWDGTSMATPHVSGVAALIWSLNTTKTNAQIRDALQKTALDKGAVGRDKAYGYGIVQAKAAYDSLAGTTPPPATITLTVTKVKVTGKYYADLAWSGAIGEYVDYYRNTTVVTTPNDGQQRDGPVARGTYTYKVCNSGTTTTCSNSVTIKF